jgi:hypothetical protein
MKPSMIKPALRYARAHRRAVFIWGPPGVGKSEVVDQIAQEDKLRLVDFRMALRDPTDIKGFPIPNLKMKTMEFLRDAELPTGGDGILFMDELNSAAPATQAAGMQLTLTGKIGDYVLPPGWSIVAAGNRETDRSVVNRMPAALANRFIHVDYEVSHDDWTAWALANGVSPLLVAFLRFRPELLHAPNYAERAFPTPRTNVFADEIVKAGLDGELQYELLKGTTGAGHAGELTAYLQVYRELPTFEQISAAPSTVPVPANMATLYALATMLGARTGKKQFDKLLPFIERMPVEYQIVTVRDALRAEPAVADTAGYVRWGIANAAVTM